MPPTEQLLPGGGGRQDMLGPASNTVESAPPPAVEAAITRWTQKIRDAKKKWSADFERMRENMRFAAGIQWEDQTTIRDDRYTLNLLPRTLGQKVASLYAKNPKVKASRRSRLDYQIWDGQLESIQRAVQEAAIAGFGPQNMEASALIADYEHGKEQREMVEKVGKTLELVYQWNIDRQEPEFKRQLKGLVRRVATCGVGYVRLDFSRRDTPTQSTTDVSWQERAKRSQDLLRRFTDGDLQEDSPEVEELKTLIGSLGATSADEIEEEVLERLVFEFPSATSVIPDPDSKALNGFCGAWWLVQEYMMRVTEVNEFFGTKVERGTSLVTYNESRDEDVSTTEQTEDPWVCVWEIFDRRTKSSFFICNGWKEYLRPPAPMTPCTKRFWPIFELTFNDIETDDDAKVTIFPPSDVDLLRSTQKEWNRSSEALRKHRKANRPKYLTQGGWMSEKDKDAFADMPDSGVIELQGLPIGVPPANAVVPMTHAVIDPALYDRTQFQQDLLLATGNQEANLGPLSGATATESSIAEQSRTTATSSNVDDLDDLLSSLARSGGEIILREFSEQTVKYIAGNGAVWPQNPAPFANELFLEIVAASSGRPNKALEIANFERMAPQLLQLVQAIVAGAPPPMVRFMLFMLKEGLKRLDERLEVEDIVTEMLGQVSALMPQQQQQQPVGGPQQPLQVMQPGAAPVPMVAA